MAKPDALADAFADDPPAAIAPCAVARVLASASDVARERLTLWLDAPGGLGGVANGQIVSRLRAAGIPIGKDSVAKHRNGSCPCPKRDDRSAR